MSKIIFHKHNRGVQEIIACGQGSGLKETQICPICGYTSRVAFEDRHGSFDIDKRNSSTHCPIHRIPLQSLGTKTRIPRRRSRKFKKFIKI